MDINDDFASEFADYVASDVPLISTRFQAVLKKHGVKNVEYYPVMIDNLKHFDSHPSYVAINIVGAESVADPDNSVYTEAFGRTGANIYDKFVVRKNFKSNLKIFRMKEQASCIIVCEELKKALEESEIDTLWFIPINDL